MRRFIRITAVATAVAVPLSMGALSLATPASATSYSVTCAKLAIKNSIATASKCSPTTGSWTSAQKKEFKTLSGSTTALAGGGSLTWAPGSGAPNTGTVTISTPTLTSPAGVCKSATKDTAIQADGVITGQVDPSVTTVGDGFHAVLCEVNKTGKITLAKGTNVEF